MTALVVHIRGMVYRYGVFICTVLFFMLRVLCVGSLFAMVTIIIVAFFVVPADAAVFFVFCLPEM